MNLRTSDLVAYALLVGSALVGLALWPTLPDRMAVHFGPGGNPDNVVAKPTAIVLAPAIGVVGVLLTRHGPDWGTRSYQGPRTEAVTVVFVGGVIAYLQLFLYAWNVGVEVSPTLAVAPVLLAAGLLVGYVTLRG